MLHFTIVEPGQRASSRNPGSYGVRYANTRGVGRHQGKHPDKILHVLLAFAQFEQEVIGVMRQGALL